MSQDDIKLDLVGDYAPDPEYDPNCSLIFTEITMDTYDFIREQETGSFSVSLRILGNEMIGFSVRADTFSTKWVVLGTIMTVAGAATASVFGPDLVALFQ